MKEIYVLGFGGSTPFFIEIAEACGYKVAGLYHYNDDRTGEIDHGFPILGSFDDLYHQNLSGKSFLLSQGDMQIRAEVTDRLIQCGGSIPTLIHPSAIVSRFACVSDFGVVIGAFCVVQNDVLIAPGAVVWDMAMICHQSKIGNYAFIGPKALVGAHCTVDDYAFIGQHATVLSGKATLIGKRSILGAGALATKPLPSNVVAAGCPARIIKILSDND